MTLAIHDIAASRFFLFWRCSIMHSYWPLHEPSRLIDSHSAVLKSLCHGPSIHFCLGHFVTSLTTAQPGRQVIVIFVESTTAMAMTFFKVQAFRLQTSLKSVNRDDWWLTGHNRHGSVITHYSTAAQSCSGWGQLPLSLKAKLNQTVLSWELLVLKLCIFWS